MDPATISAVYRSARQLLPVKQVNTRDANDFEDYFHTTQSANSTFEACTLLHTPTTTVRRELHLNASLSHAQQAGWGGLR